MNDKRPIPEVLLKRVQEEERKQNRGRLKIYLGAAPGVGKTHEMLSDAIGKREQGLDVIAGVVESHGRMEIETLLKRIEILPRISVDYRGKELLEFDLDGALQRNPGLILIDEMAHTNAPDLRHAKRWQDIKELLEHGIDVYTTLNVQHIESLIDDVAQIIQAPIKETVPDSMLELADTIEVVDLPPEDLLKRLQEGKIYIPAQAELAVENFFRKGNLIALRELALRITANRVGAEVLMYREGEGITRIWPTKDKILVCVGPHAESLKLIRAAKRIASGLQAEWLAVYVDVSQRRSATERRNKAIQNLHLAEQLGAQIHVLTGTDIVKEVMNFARRSNVTQLMIWKRIHTRWIDWLRRSLVDEMLRNSHEIDVYIMTGESRAEVGTLTRASIEKRKMSWKGYGLALLATVIITIINVALFPVMSTTSLVMMYFMSTAIVAWFGKIGPTLFASALSVLLYNFFFIPPLQSFVMLDGQGFMTLLVIFLGFVIISQVIIKARQQASAAKFVQHQTSDLYALSRRLMRERGVDKLLEIGIHFIASAFDSEVNVLWPKRGRLNIRASTVLKQRLDSKEHSIAQWVYESGKIAGCGTDTLAFSEALYLPLLASQETLGVLRLTALHKQLFSPEQMQLLNACIYQLSLALEVDRLQERARKKELKIESERVSNTLLQTISYNLRMPLITAIDAASNTIEFEKIGAEILEKGIYYEIEQVNQLNNNLLQILQFEATELSLEKTSSSLEAIVRAALKFSTHVLGARKIRVDIAKEIPYLLVNSALIQEVFFNLIDNIVKVTDSSSVITINTVLAGDRIVVRVEYRGLLINFNAEDTTAHSTLGLALSEKVVEAHGGELWVEELADGHAAFCFSLPL